MSIKTTSKYQATADRTSSAEAFQTEVDAAMFVDDGSTTRTLLLRRSTGVWDPLGNALADCTCGWIVTPMNCYEFASLSADGKTLGELQGWTYGIALL